MTYMAGKASDISSTIRTADDPPSFCGRGQEIPHLRVRGGGRSPSGSFPIAPATPSVLLL